MYTYDENSLRSRAAVCVFIVGMIAIYGSLAAGIVWALVNFWPVIGQFLTWLE